MDRCLLLLVAGAALSSAANILVMLPLPLYSHMNGYRPLLEALARRGHNVTVVSPFPRKEPLTNYTDIFINSSLTEVTGLFKENGNNFDPMDSSFWNRLKGSGPICEVLEHALLTKPDLLDFIREDRSHFDIVITESWACQEALAVLSHKYSAHLIALSPVLLGSIESHYIGSTLPYSYVPHLRLPSSDRMSFLERIKSSMLHTADLLLHLYVYMPKKESFVRQYIKFPGSEDLPPLADILKNHSLVLVEGHYSLTFPRPNQLNVIEIGGLSVKKASPLPKDLEDYMSGAKDGVILVSWGSMFRATQMNSETLAKLMSVFSKLKQQVLMKWEIQDIPGKPDNVKILPWIPQASLLEHPNLVAFISHCGIHGFAEATYNGVPILATPLFYDQYQNAKVAEGARYAIVVDINSFSEDILLQSIQKIIYDPSYKESALRRSSILRKPLVPPLDHAIYWIEYVLEHNGAKHLRPASVHIPWYEYFLLDILGLVLLVILGVSTIPVFFCKLFNCRKHNKKPKND